MSEPIETIRHSMNYLATFIEQEPDKNLSPQLRKKLWSLIESHSTHGGQMITKDYVNRLSSFYNRFLLELVQAHYHTKQRENDAKNLIENKGCTVKYPELTDKVLKLLTTLYNAVDQCDDISFERSVLIKFLHTDEDCRSNERTVKKIVQTLYRSDCFHIIKKENAPARFKLKEELYDFVKLRQKHDVGMIGLVQNEFIRLSPKSWANLLRPHRASTDLDIISEFQSLLDKYQTKITIEELERAISINDRYGLEALLEDLRLSYDLMSRIENSIDKIDLDFVKAIENLITLLVKLKPLFTIRQIRKKPCI